MLSVFKMAYNHEESTKTFCRAKEKDTVDHNTVNRWFKKFHSGCKSLDDQVRSGNLKAEDSEAVLQVIDGPVD